MKPYLKKYQPVDYYFVAEPSHWPIVGSVGLFMFMFGFVQVLHGNMPIGPVVMGAGVLTLLTTMVGWFGAVIKESVNGLHSHQMDRTYRWAMVWFIVSEISLFGIFFGALFYVRIFGLSELGDNSGELARTFLLTKGAATHKMLWPDFQDIWPLLKNPNPTLFPGPKESMGAWGIPALNTLLLLSSGVTITIAHWALKKNNRPLLILGLLLTVVLGFTFEGFQIYEYHDAYTELGLTLKSGIYGATFYMLTGLHAMHVTVGAIMLTVILIRCLKGHFQPEHHFGFEAASWYWHFVDVVWLFLFCFVYWL